MRAWSTRPGSPPGRTPVTTPPGNSARSAACPTRRCTRRFAEHEAKPHRVSASGDRLPAGPIVFDASFLIALLEGEPAAQRFAPVLPRGIVPSVTAGEVFYKLHTGAGLVPAQIEGGLLGLGVALVALPPSTTIPCSPRTGTGPPSPPTDSPPRSTTSATPTVNPDRLRLGQIMVG